MTADLFICSDEMYCEEESIMPNPLELNSNLSEGSPHPHFPTTISLDMTKPIRDLVMYTNNLRQLAAPAELCIMKALELINDRDNYEINIEVFRADLLKSVLGETGVDDVNALVAGIRCICTYLMDSVDHHTGGTCKFFPYEFFQLYRQTQLFMVIISPDATLSKIRPATVPLPATAYSDLPRQTREDHPSEANYSLVF